MSVPSLGLGRVGGFFYGTAAAAHSELAQNQLQWTELSERRLQQVESDEGSKPKPIWAVVMRQQQAD